MNKKRKLKKKFIVFFSFYVVLLSSFLIAQTVAKFASSASIDGNVSVAKWDVSANIPNATITVAPSGINTYDLTIVTDSDVSLSYSIMISSLPLKTYVAVDSSNYSSGASSVTFNRVGTIKANATSKTKTHVLKFKTVPEVTEVTNQPVKIDVIFTQNEPQ